MKKLLLSLSVLLILGLPKISAQLINAGFETWTRNPNNKDSLPDPNSGNATSGWWDFNVASNPAFGGAITVYKDSAKPAPENGKYYAAIVSQTMSPSTYGILQTYGFPYGQTNGILFTGYENVNLKALTASFKTGIPVSGGELNSFSFYYRYAPNGSDSCSCSIAMYYWDPNAKKRTMIGGGFWGSTATQKSWTSVTVPIVYSNTNVNPDTVLIVFSACALSAANNPKQYDTLDIDNSSVTGIGSINAPHDNVNLYPNPAQSQVNLVVSGQYQANRVEVYDITGKMIGIYSMNNNSLTINTQSYTSGLYLYKLLSNTGVQLNVGKFNVVK